MWERKRFETSVDVEEFSRMQDLLSGAARMQVFTARHGGASLGARGCEAVPTADSAAVGAARANSLFPSEKPYAASGLTLWPNQLATVLDVLRAGAPPTPLTVELIACSCESSIGRIGLAAPTGETLKAAPTEDTTKTARPSLRNAIHTPSSNPYDTPRGLGCGVPEILAAPSLQG